MSKPPWIHAVKLATFVKPPARGPRGRGWGRVRPVRGQPKLVNRPSGCGAELAGSLTWLAALAAGVALERVDAHLRQGGSGREARLCAQQLGNTALAVAACTAAGVAPAGPDLFRGAAPGLHLAALALAPCGRPDATQPMCQPDQKLPHQQMGGPAGGLTPATSPRPSDMHSCARLCRGCGRRGREAEGWAAGHPTSKSVEALRPGTKSGPP